jgi:L-ribulose-5-phosphate 3-epimerase
MAAPMNEIGIRQGRLSPSSSGPVQRFPHESWGDEFRLARDCGLQFVEWLFAADGYEHNPVWSEDGLSRIRTIVEATGVGVRSLCADYFMAHPFVRVTQTERLESARILCELILRSSRAGIAVVVVPLLEAGEVLDATELRDVRDALEGALDIAGERSVTLALESDLPAPAIASIADLAPHPALGVCYDTGNAAAKGFDVAADLARLCPLLSVAHLKDRDRRGTSVGLGTGLADLSAFFRNAAHLSFRGPLVLETPRGADSLSSAKANLAFSHACAATFAASAEGFSVR